MLLMTTGAGSCILLGGLLARVERHWAPTLGAVLGFSLGLLGDLLIHGP